MDSLSALVITTRIPKFTFPVFFPYQEPTSPDACSAEPSKNPSTFSFPSCYPSTLPLIRQLDQRTVSALLSGEKTFDTQKSRPGRAPLDTGRKKKSAAGSSLREEACALPASSTSARRVAVGNDHINHRWAWEAEHRALLYPNPLVDRRGSRSQCQSGRGCECLSTWPTQYPNQVQNEFP